MEIWKDIKGYEGYYQVSNLGSIKRLHTIVKNKRWSIFKRISDLLTKHS